jgi:riboflavin kinase/FMN adenylyltransferase
MKYTATVLEGSRLGRTIGFPTLNLDNPALLKDKEKGVYASNIWIDEKKYTGALYFGPRLVVNETKVVLEIFVFEFDQNVYGKTIDFEIADFIRPVMNFDSFKQMQQQLQQDCDNIRRLLQ